MKLHAMRLRLGTDLKNELIKFVKENNIQAAFIGTCVGCLKSAKIRLAGAKTFKELDKKLEIVSLVGTLSPDGVHVHISLADEDGKTVGGHVQEGCIVYVTAEIIICECKDFIFSREFDTQTNFKELKISKR